MRPRSRRDLLVQELGEDVLVYDFATHGAHCLDRSAHAVFRLCDGEHTRAQIAAEVSRVLGPVDVTWVQAALERLQDAKLLEEAPKSLERIRRRELLTAGAVLAVPAVWSIVAPSVAEAASRQCVPQVSCMGSGISTCCGGSGQSAMSCSGNGQCNGSGAFCNYTCR